MLIVWMQSLCQATRPVGHMVVIGEFGCTGLGLGEEYVPSIWSGMILVVPRLVETRPLDSLLPSWEQLLSVSASAVVSGFDPATSAVLLHVGLHRQLPARAGLTGRIFEAKAFGARLGTCWG